MKPFDNYLEGLAQDPLTFKKSDPLAYEMAEWEWKVEQIQNVDYEEITKHIREGYLMGKVGNVSWCCLVTEDEYDAIELASEIKKRETSGTLDVGGYYDLTFSIS